MTNQSRSWDDRLTDIERALADLERRESRVENEVRPLVDFYNAGTLVGKLLWIIGGLIVGVTTVWAALSGWITSHWK